MVSISRGLQLTKIRNYILDFEVQYYVAISYLY